MGGQLFHRDAQGDILIDVGQDILHLMAVFVFRRSCLGGVGIGQSVDQHHQLHESGLLHDVVGVAPGGSHFADIIEEAALGGFVQGDLVLEALRPVREAVVQVRIRGGYLLHVIRVDGQHDALMDVIIDLGQFVALVLVDEKYVSGGDCVEAVVYQKLPAAGDGIIQFVAVMDVHVHGFFFLIEMGDGKGLRAKAVLYGCLAGTEFFHVGAPFFLHFTGRVQNLQDSEKYLNRN